MTNTLYYGDNLDILRQHIPEESVDLVYLDPPFNSNASYNVLFKERSGEESPAQIKAFKRQADPRVGEVRPRRRLGVDPGVGAPVGSPAWTTC